MSADRDPREPVAVVVDLNERKHVGAHWWADYNEHSHAGLTLYHVTRASPIAPRPAYWSLTTENRVQAILNRHRQDREYQSALADLCLLWLGHPTESPSTSPEAADGDRE